MKNDKISIYERICSSLSLALSIWGVIYSIAHDSLNWIVLFSVSLVFIIVLIFFMFGYKKLNNKLVLYDELLSSPYPLYGILNYVSKKQKIEKKNIVNRNYKLDSLSLNAKLVNTIDKNKHNDLLLLWDFNGNNISHHDKLGKLYLRIGGDSSTDFEKLNIVGCQCNLSNDDVCDIYQKCQLCPSCENKCQYEDKRKITLNNNGEFSSATFHLLEMDLARPVEKSHMLKTKISYIWPQCFNPNFDYLLIDPNNFGNSVKELNIKIYCDGIVIKKGLNIHLFSINITVYKQNNEGIFDYDENGDLYYFQLKKIRPNNLYYVKIIL